MAAQEEATSAAAPAAKGVNGVKGASFGVRSAAHLLVDLPLALAILTPLIMALMIWVYGFESLLRPGGAKIPWWWEVVFQVVIVAALVALWHFTQATPGKRLFRLIIVDGKTGGKPDLRQWLVRALGYLVASMPVVPVPVTLMGHTEKLWVPLGLGFFWILVSRRNHGWHDLMSGTVTVRREG